MNSKLDNVDCLNLPQPSPQARSLLRRSRAHLFVIITRLVLLLLLFCNRNDYFRTTTIY